MNDRPKYKNCYLFFINSYILCDYVKYSLIDWKRENSNYDIRRDLDLSGTY